MRVNEGRFVVLVHTLPRHYLLLYYVYIYIMLGCDTAYPIGLALYVDKKALNTRMKKAIKN